MQAVERFWIWIDQRSIVRRIVLFITLWMTWAAFQWAASFAVTSAKAGIDIAAIIAAVTAPISVLQGYVFKVYSEGRKG